MTWLVYSLLHWIKHTNKWSTFDFNLFFCGYIDTFDVITPANTAVKSFQTVQSNNRNKFLITEKSFFKVQLVVYLCITDETIPPKMITDINM